MGIVGLTNFMNSAILDHVLESIKLENCTILIDGYSLLHKINNGIFCLSSTHGGNYDEIAAKLENLFRIFDKCHIKPVFLFDGGKAKDDRKFQTSLKRAKSKISDTILLNNSCTHNSKNNKNKKLGSKISLDSFINSGVFRVLNNLLPILAYKTLFNMIEKFNYEAYQCYFEADYDLAILANEYLKCPLLSSDSDFFIYDLKYGYIPIDYFDIHAQCSDEEENESYFLEAKLYHIDKFIDYFNRNLCDYGTLSLKKELLSVFALLCGNDYVDRSVFGSLLSTFDTTNNNLSRAYRKKSKQAYSKYKNNYYYRLLDWLVQFNDIDDCLNTILKYVKTESHDLIRKCVCDSLSEYMCKKKSETSLLLQKFSGEYKDEDTELLCVNGSRISNEFLRNFLELRFSRLSLDVLIHSRVIFNCQIELRDWQSVYLSSINIRQVFYSILFRKFTHKSPDLGQQEVVKEYLRVENQLKIFNVEILDSIYLDSFQNEDYLFDKVYSLKNGENFDSCLKIDQKLKTFFMVLNYWIKNLTKVNQHENFKRAFLVSLIKYSLIDPCYRVVKSFRDEAIGQKSESCLKIYDSTCSKFDESKFYDWSQNFTNRFLINNQENVGFLKELKFKLTNQFCMQTSSLSDYHNHKIEKSVNLRLVHLLCEYQSIYLSITYLYECLNKTSDLIDLIFFFNGSFLHNLIEDLEHRINPELYVEELLGRRSYFKVLYCELSSLYDRLFLIENAEVKTNSEQVELKLLTAGESSSSDMDKKKLKNFKKNMKRKLKKQTEAAVENLEEQINKLKL
jgi:hypothetical protein